MTRLGNLLIVATIALFGAGCISVAPAEKGANPIEISTATSTPVIPEWKIVAPSVDRYVQMTSVSSTARLTLYRFAVNSIELSFEHSTSAGSIAAWHALHPEALAIMNGGYFDESLLPAGFLQTHGKKVGPRFYDIDKSAFLIGGQTPQLVETKSTGRFEKESFVLQSYPVLIRDGQAAVKTESGKTARRSFVGIDKRDRLYLGIVDGGGVTLFELAKLLESLNVEWKTVLNLDGGPSTGLSVSANDWKELTDSWTSIPNVLLIKRKE